MRTTTKFLFSSIFLALPAKAESSLDLNFGLAPTKSVLGVSFTSGYDQLNVGVKGFVIGSRGYLIQPGVTYNRYFTMKGFYGSLTYAPIYRNEEVSRFRRTGPNVGDYEFETLHVTGWEAGTAFLGAGKSFQFTRWGLHVDGGFVTPADAEVAQRWGYWIGAGASYRFKLDEAHAGRH